MCNSPMFFLEVKKICLSLQSILRNMFQEMAEVLSRKCRKLCGNSSVGRAQPCQGWGREFESRFPLQAGQHELACFFLTEDSNSRPAPRGSCRPGPAEGTTKEVAPCPRTRARVSFSAPSRSALAGLLFYLHKCNDVRSSRTSFCIDILNCKQKGQAMKPVLSCQKKSDRQICRQSI